MNDTIEKFETDARKLVDDYVAENPYELNPDSHHVDKIIKSLAKRKLKNGFFYCPCRMLSDDKEIDAKIICPCEYHKEEIEKDGICSCDLFVSPDYKPASAV
ncbi:ferredoxin-thioredoxin reductase, catalytic subunit [Candidatus Scalindua japonica]|uniref:ferredoxin:thioredoxin reductase n=1 Tax=Candidatus Scalindua japonica TaxID=1284222 RepID=A0A286U227_9BACT|nr:ferredoxin-thioredoxin reductase catalytic domain-containing protein [Candidatus Scalindua japonica]GAX62177.1 ferredoxin-thioredoxin reductase, catalytic subunit [Candidatus Scalindua japonica]